MTKPPIILAIGESACFAAILFIAALAWGVFP